MSEAEKRLKELGIELIPEDLTGNILKLRRDENILYLSGNHCRTKEGELIYEGKLGQEVTQEQGYEAARQVGINQLSVLKDYLGNLDRIDKILKVKGYVASDPDFHNQPEVMYGFTDLMVEVFGKKGLHARSAIGVPVLPRNMPVEVEMIVKIRD